MVGMQSALCGGCWKCKWVKQCHELMWWDLVSVWVFFSVMLSVREVTSHSVWITPVWESLTWLQKFDLKYVSWCVYMGRNEWIATEATAQVDEILVPLSSFLLSVDLLLTLPAALYLSLNMGVR